MSGLEAVAKTTHIEFCREADLPELFAVFADWYRFNPRLQEKDFFDWQFRDPPTRLSREEYDFLILRNDAGRIAGCLGMVGFEFRCEGRIATGGWTHNWQAETKGEGGFALLSRFLQLVDNRFMLRINENSAGVFRLLRIPILPAIPRWWGVLDAERAAALFKIESSADQAILKRSAAMLGGNDAAPIGRHVSRFEPGDEFMLDRWPGVRGYVRRTGTYLNWRYVDIPKHDYRLLRTETGLAVYRIETIMGTEASAVRILEWTLDAAESAGALAAILDAAASRTPILVDFQCTHAPIGQALERLGFMPQSSTAAPVPDLFRPTNYSGGYAAAIDLPPHRTQKTVDFNCWYMTTGESDIDRVKL